MAIGAFCLIGCAIMVPRAEADALDIALGSIAIDGIAGQRVDRAVIPEIEHLPYYLYINKPRSQVDGKVQVNSVGYRSPDVSLQPLFPAPGATAIGTTCPK